MDAIWVLQAPNFKRSSERRNPRNEAASAKNVLQGGPQKPFLVG